MSKPQISRLHFLSHRPNSFETDIKPLSQRSIMPKRELTPTNTPENAKRTRISKTFAPVKVATAAAAAEVDGNTPLYLLKKAMEKVVKNPEKGESVIYWMRMADLRSKHI